MVCDIHLSSWDNSGGTGFGLEKTVGIRRTTTATAAKYVVAGDSFIGDMVDYGTVKTEIETERERGRDVVVGVILEHMYMGNGAGWFFLAVWYAM